MAYLGYKEKLDDPWQPHPPEELLKRFADAYVSVMTDNQQKNVDDDGQPDQSKAV